jgi:hypothetical protein
MKLKVMWHNLVPNYNLHQFDKKIRRIGVNTGVGTCVIFPKTDHYLRRLMTYERYWIKKL